MTTPHPRRLSQLLADADQAHRKHRVVRPINPDLGLVIRNRVRRHQQRRFAATASLGLLVAFGGVVLLWQSAPPAQRTPQAGGTHRHGDTDFLTQQAPVSTDQLIQQAASARTLARALAEPSVEPPPINNTALITDLVLRLTELESTTWLDRESAAARYTQLIELFPDTPAAQTAQSRLDRLNLKGPQHVPAHTNPA